MKIFRAFFKRTRIFWSISRLILGLIFGYCAYFLLEDILPGDLFSVVFFVALSAVILWVFYADLLRNGAHKAFKIFTGSVLITMGLLGVYSTWSIFGFSEYPAMLLACLWFLLAGLFDLSGLQTKEKDFGKSDLVRADSDSLKS